MKMDCWKTPDQYVPPSILFREHGARLGRREEHGARLGRREEHGARARARARSQYFY